MKKMIFTLVLAIAGSVWMMSKAQCLVPSTEQEGPYVEELTGLLCLDAYPCPYNEICPACLTVVLRSKEKKYYLTGPVAESIDVPTDWQYVKVVVSGITGNTELGNNEYYNWLTVEKWSYSEEPITTNIQTYGYVEDESGTRLEGIGVIVHTTDWTVSDTVYSQAQGMFISSIKGIAYPVNSMEVTVSDITGKFKEQTKSTTYTYECGVDFNPETNTASNSEELLFVLQENKIRTTLPSLCDEWNVLEVENALLLCGGCEVKHTVVHRLTSDTIIDFLHYVKLMKENSYEGALREGIHRDIYYIPNGSTHEYLLYDFNAQVGDKLTNLWVGDNTIKSATIIEIEPTTPRTFVLSVEYYQSGYLDTTTVAAWIEGVGSPAGPTGRPGFIIPNSRAYSVLCAYKNGEQVYTSAMGEQYGCEYNYDPSQPMFPSDTKWHYVYTEMYGGPDFKPRYFSVSPIDTVINNTHYQKINGILFRSDATKVWCVIDSMDTRIERLVYDFDLQVGDSIRKLCYGYDGYWTEEPYCEESRYAKVTNVEYIQLGDGRMARRLSYDNRPDDIEHIGCVDGIFAPLNFPVSTCGCGDYFQCCTRGDVLLYEVESGACDTFFIKEQPTDTIPLYARDDSGSSTVDPVDPNQIYATLTGNVLTIHNRTGVQVTFTLNNTSSNNLAARVRKNGQPTTFMESISVELTEDGLYEILLTSEEWNYSVFGTINYVRSSTSTTKEDQPLTTKKLLRGTQILIKRGDKTYTLTGQEVK